MLLGVVVGCSSGAWRARSSCAAGSARTARSSAAAARHERARHAAARDQPGAARTGAAARRLRARRQEVADRPAARLDDRRARQGRASSCASSKATGARRSASSATSCAASTRASNALSRAHPAAARGARELEGARPVGRAHGRRRAAARRLPRRRQLPQAGDARRARAGPTTRSCCPTGCVMHMDVKFPLDNYVRYLEADQRRRARAVPRPVPPRRARPGEGAHRRAATSTRPTRPSTACCCSSRTSRCTRSSRSTTATHPRRRAAPQDRAVLAAHAVRGARGRPPGGRQLPARAHVERDPRAARRVLAAVGEVRRRSSRRCSSDSSGVAKEYAALMTTRHRALQRPLDKIEHAAPRGAARLARRRRSPPLAARSRESSRVGDRVASPRMTRVAVLGGGQLGLDARAGRHPARAARSAFLDPSPEAPAARGRRPGRRRRSTTSRPRRRRPRAPTSSPTSGRACPPPTARALGARRAGAPGAARARGVAGPPRREGDVPRARHRDRAVPRRSTTAAISRRRGRRRSASRRC